MPTTATAIERLNCVFLEERYRKEATDWMIARVRVLPSGDASVVEDAEQDMLTDACLADGMVIDVTGVAPPGAFEEGLSYAMWGKEGEYQGRKNFAFTRFEPIVPMDAESIVDYLTRAGAGHGVGRARARQIYEKFGPQSIRVCREDPMSVVNAIRGLDFQRMAGMVEWLKNRQIYEQTLVGLNQLLGGRGFPKSLPFVLVEKYGNQSVDMVTKNPFILMAERGCGASLCDRLWLELKKPESSLKRQAYVIASAISESARLDGSVWVRVNDALHHAEKRLKSKLRFRMAVRFGLRTGLLNAKKTAGIDGPISDAGDTLWLAIDRAGEQESLLAERVIEAISESYPRQQLRHTKALEIVETPISSTHCYRCHRELTAEDVWIVDNKPYGPTCIDSVDPDRAVATKVSLQEWMSTSVRRNEVIVVKASSVEEVTLRSYWPHPDSIPDISDHQRDALRKAFFLPDGKPSRIAIIGGCPGTGKTRTVANTIKAIQNTGIGNIIAGAPTGKAAVKLTATLHSYGVTGITAKTWHSILGQEKIGAGWGFAHRRDNRLQATILVGDEESMQDLQLQYSKWQARGTNCHMLIVGDINQLAPVGPGATLRDFIGAGLPYGELREIWRNDGGIVEACRAIRDLERWHPGGNLSVGQESSPEAQIHSILNVINKARRDGLDPVWDVQPLVIVNENSKVSRVELNKLLQRELNPNQPEERCPFAIDDKLINLENGNFKVLQCEDGVELNADRETRVANGEQGKLVEIEAKHYVIELQTPYRLIRAFRGTPAGNLNSEIYSNEEQNAAEKVKTKTGSSWDLGYAISAWKSQGSDWPIVIPVLDTSAGARRLACRELIYTMLSRGRVHCHVAGELEIGWKYCDRASLPLRKTFLREEIVKKWIEFQLGK